MDTNDSEWGPDGVGRTTGVFNEKPINVGLWVIIGFLSIIAIAYR